MLLSSPDEGNTPFPQGEPHRGRTSPATNLWNLWLQALEFKQKSETVFRRLFPGLIPQWSCEEGRALSHWWPITGPEAGTRALSRSGPTLNDR